MSPEAESLNGREGDFLPDNNHFYDISVEQWIIIIIPLLALLLLKLVPTSGGIK